MIAQISQQSFPVRQFRGDGLAYEPFLQKGQHVVDRKDGAGAHGQAALPPVKGQRHFDHFLVCVQGAAGVFRGDFARFVQGDLAAFPIEQGNAQSSFQLFHVAAQGGLGDVQFLRRPAEGACAGKSIQLLQQKNIDHGQASFAAA